MRNIEIQQYIECYLSEQIPERDWYILLRDNPQLKIAWEILCQERHARS